MLRVMMRLARASPGETLVVGDMEIDAEMARAAGCRVILVPSGSLELAMSSPAYQSTLCWRI